MELYLRLEDQQRTHIADVEVRVEASHTIQDVAVALADFLGYDSRSAVPLSRPETGQLRPDLSISEAGVVSGETLILGIARYLPETAPGELSLVIASGPDSGTSQVLTPGTFIIGRDASCFLTLSDPQVSRQHVRLIVDSIGNLTIESLAPDRNEVRTAGRAVTEVQPLAKGQLIRLGATTMVVRHEPVMQRTRIDAFGQVPFHRTPYFAAPVQEVEIDAMRDVPSAPEKARFAILSAILPIVMGVSLALIIGSPRFLMFAVFSPVMVVGNYFEQKRRSGNKHKDSIERFNQDLGLKSVEVRGAVEVERWRRTTGAPDIADLNGRAQNRSIDLWVRDKNAFDFLNLRVGVGNVPSKIKIKDSNSGDIKFRDQMLAAYGVTDVVTDVPVALNLAELGVVGLIGRASETSSMAASMAVQAATLHSPEDLVIFAALAPARDILDWLKWMPHSGSSSSPLGGSHLVSTKEQADALVRDLTGVAADRISRSSSQDTDNKFPWLLLFLDRALEPDAAVVSRLLDACPAVGISVVWLTDTRERVPRQAQAIVECQSPLTGEMSRVMFTDPEVEDQYMDIDRVDHAQATRTGQALAPLRDASSANAATALPRVVPLFSAFGIDSVNPNWVAQQWAIDRGYSLQGPIGMAEGGPLMLDMVEHGPHGLIGGTSGAGKSELVMSMVASLIAHNPPSRINFLFIDYKGGASSDLFKDVPHTVGFVTNLDGLLAMRALTSLRAELNRRMDLMQGRAKDLAEMIEKYPEDAPPSLIIVVDEFATLVKEIPDFVAGIVDISQRGRSLGIHLVLATQRPSGSVNENIKANTNLRISLRMLDSAESKQVIGTGDAAALPAPLKGRGYARLGPGELVAFQSAWAGAPLLAAKGVPPVAVKPFGRTPLPPLALARLHAPSVKDSLDEDDGPERTQIDALLDCIVEAANELGYERGRAPWLDTLPLVLPIEDVRKIVIDRSDELRPGERVAIGMVDNPEAQAQYPLILNLARSGGMIGFGTGGTGKTTMLQTAAISAAMDDSDLGGGHLSIFGLDFASRGLGALNSLPQCGGVAASDNVEGITRILTVLTDEFERRRDALADAVARSMAPPKHSTILLLIDGIDGMIAMLETATAASGLTRFYEMTLRLIADGRQVGIYPIMTASRRTAVRQAIMAAISDRITLRQAEAMAYQEAGISSAQSKGLELDPGQGFYNDPTMIQIAKVTDPNLTGDESLEERELAERERFAELASALTGHVDPKVVNDALPSEVGLLPSPDPLKPVVGLTNLSLAPSVLDLTFNDTVVYGDPRSGRSTVLATVASQVASAGGEVWVIAPPSSRLVGLTGVAKTCFEGGEPLTEFFTELKEASETSPQSNRLLVFDDFDLLDETDRELIGLVTECLGSTRYIASGERVRGYASNPLLAEFKKARSLIFLMPTDARDAQEVLGILPVWQPGLPMGEGRGYLSADRQAKMVQFSDAFLGLAQDQTSTAPTRASDESPEQPPEATPDDQFANQSINNGPPPSAENFRTDPIVTAQPAPSSEAMTVPATPGPIRNPSSPPDRAVPPMPPSPTGGGSTVLPPFSSSEADTVVPGHDPSEIEDHPRPSPPTPPAEYETDS